MSGHKLTYEKAKEAVDALQSALDEGFLINGKPSAWSRGAALIGLPDPTFRKRVSSAAKHHGLKPVLNGKKGGVEMPDFPPEDVPIETVLAYKREVFETRAASYRAHTWFPIKVAKNLPIGIMWFGDPHVDDDGCNMPVLERDVELCVSTPGMYGANVGDTTNNWAGRLVRLYADQEASLPTARRLAEWFMLDSGINWLVYLLGNHDLWGDGSAVLAQMAKRYGTQKLVLHEWEARFMLEFPSGWSPRVYTAHNFKGTSIWNPMHGPMREGQIGEFAELYVCGDKHTSGSFTFENPAKDHAIQNFIRVRGYKFLDSHGRMLGFKEQQTGCAAVSVFDPVAQKVSAFLDVEEGCDFLAMKRARAGA